MSIKGLTGIRVNIWDKAEGIFRSPHHKSYVWDEQGIAVSSCRVECWNPNDLCVRGFPKIGEFCSCGIYTSHFEDYVHQYGKRQFAVWFLVEALGTNIWAYPDCHRGAICAFRAPAVQVIAVINYSRDPKRTIQTKDETINLSTQSEALLAAVDYFKVPVITLDQARAVTRAMWEKSGFPWQDNFF